MGAAGLCETAMNDVIALIGKTRLFGNLEPDTQRKVAQQSRPVS